MFMMHRKKRMSLFTRCLRKGGEYGKVYTAFGETDNTYIEFVFYSFYHTCTIEDFISCYFST